MATSPGGHAGLESARPGADGSVTRALFLLAIATFASVATMRVADPLLPQVADDFGVSTGDAAIIGSAFSIAYAFGQFVHGPLGDRFGKLRMIAIMTILSAFTVSAAGFVGSLTALSMTRLMAGATAAAIAPLAMAFIGDHVAYENRQAVLARFLSGTILGMILGQAFGGIIGDWLGWRAVFPMLGAIFLVIGLLLLLDLYRGCLPPPLLSKTLSLSSLSRNYGTLIRDRWARIVLLIVFVEGFFFYSAFTFIGADLHQRFGLNYTTVGFTLCFFGIGGLCYALVVRQLVKRLGERGLALGGGGLLSLGLMAIIVFPLMLMPLGLFIFGLGLYMLHNTLQTNATQMAPETRGLAVSTFANSFFVGQAAGVFTGGLLVDRYGFTFVYICAAIGLLLLGTTFSRLIRERAKAA
ncbi:MAG: MFS transporter [Geminicoccaceae bacterium]